MSDLATLRKVAGLLACVWLAGSIVAGVFIYRPNPKLWIVANRRRAIITFVVVFIGLRLGESLVAWRVYSEEQGAPTASAPPAPKPAGVTPPENSVAEQTPTSHAADNQAGEAPAVDPLKEARESPFEFLRLVGPDGGRPRYTKAGFGVVNLVTGKVVNSGPLAYKDATLRCEYRAESGTVLGVTRRTVYQVFPAHSTKRLVNFNTGFVDSQAVGASCIIEDAQVVPGP